MHHLYLSHWNDDKKVFVQSNLVKKLKKYHVDTIRFIYNCYRKKFKGLVINYNDGMNIPLAIQAFLQAIFQSEKLVNPILVLTTEHDVCKWHYHLRQIDDVHILKEQNHLNVFNNPGIIIASFDNMNYVHPFRENDFSFVIVDKMDSVATKLIFKKLSGEFNVALTVEDFIEERNQKMLWTLLNWTNPGLFGKLAAFYESDQNHFKNLRDPYKEVWLRLTWNVEEGYTEDSPEEQEKYTIVLRQWAKQYNIHCNAPSQRKTKKRRNLDESQSNCKTTKVETNQIFKAVDVPSVTVNQNQKDHENTLNEVKSSIDSYCNLGTATKRKFTFDPQLCDSNEQVNKLSKTNDLSKLKNRKYKNCKNIQNIHEDSGKIKAVTFKLQQSSINNNSYDAKNNMDNQKCNVFETESKNIEVIDDLSRNSDDCDLLLKIMNGNFTPSPHKISDVTNIDLKEKPKFVKTDSNSLLLSLYGEEAEFVEKSEENFTSIQKTNSLENNDVELLSSLFDYSEVESQSKLSQLKNSKSQSKITFTDDLMIELFDDNQDSDDDFKYKKSEKMTDLQRNSLISSLFED